MASKIRIAILADAANAVRGLRTTSSEATKTAERIDALDKKVKKLDGQKASVHFDAKGFAQGTAQIIVANLALDQIRKGMPDLSMGLTGVANKLTVVSGAAMAAASAVGPLVGLTVGLGAALGAAGAGVALFAAAAAPAFKEVTESVKKYTAAQENLQKAQASGDSKGAVKAQEDMAEALSGLTPMQRESANALIGMQASWDKLSQSQAPTVLRILTGAATAMSRVIPQLTPAIDSMGTALSGISGSAFAGLEKSATPFANFITTQGVPAVKSLSTIMGNLLVTVGHVAQAFAPLGNTILSQLAPITGELRKLDFSRFASSAQGLLPLVSSLLGNLGGAVGNLLKAIAPLARPVLQGLSDIGATLKTALGGPEVKTFVSNIAKIVPAVAPIVAVLVPAFTQFAAIISGQVLAIVPQILPLVKQMADVFINVLTGVSPLIPAIMELVGVLVSFIPVVFPIVTALRDALMPVIETLSDVLIDLQPSISTVVDAFTKLFKPLSQVIVAVLEVAPAIIDALVPAFAAVVDAIAEVLPALTPLFPVLAELVKELAPPFTDLIKALTPVFPLLAELVVAFADVAAEVLVSIAPAVGTVLKVAFDVLIGVAKSVVKGLTALFDFLKDNQSTLEVVAGIITTLLVPAIVSWGVEAVTAKAKVVGAWLAARAAAIKSAAVQIAAHTQTTLAWIQAAGRAVANAARVVAGWVAAGAAATKSAVVQLAAHARVAVGWIAGAARATASAAIVVAGWVATGAAATASAIKQAAAWVVSQAGAVAAGITMAVTAAGVVAGWVLMGTQALIQAGRMALAWIIAMGPVAWIIAAVIGLVAIIILNWDKIVTWTKTAWTAVTGAVVTAWNAIKAFVSAAITAVVNFIRNNWKLLVSIIGGPLAAIVILIISNWDRIKSFVSSAVSAVVGFVSRAWNAVKSATITAWNAVKSAVSNGISGVIKFVTGLPGKIKGAVSGAASWLYNVGADVVQGMINGIGSMVGSLVGKVRDLAGSAIKTAMSALGESSPSKVFKEIGRYVGVGFIEGLVSTQSAVIRSVRTLGNKIAAAFPDVTKRLKSGKRVTIENQTQNRLVALVQTQGAKLATLAKRRDAIAKQMSAANATLADLQKARADTLLSIADKVRDSFKLADTAAENGLTSMRVILSRSALAVKQAADFTAAIATLKARGLNTTAIQELAESGPQAAAGTIRALLKGSSSDIAQLNKNYAALAANGAKAGTAVASALYDAGIQAANGLVRGLTRQKASIEATMLAIAKGMQTAIKRALGIKSPSSVFRTFGLQTIQGFADGFQTMSGEAIIKPLVSQLKSAAPSLPGTIGVGQHGTVQAVSGTGAAPIHITINTGVVIDKRGLVDTITSAVNDVSEIIGRPIKMNVAAL